MGPFATWKYIKKISASIPTQQKVKDHVEAELNHFLRGKAHTTPDKENDVERLQSAYQRSKVHDYVRGRQVKGTTVKDYLALGSEPGKLKNTIKNWAEKRLSERGSLEDWDSSSESS